MAAQRSEIRAGARLKHQREAAQSRLDALGKHAVGALSSTLDALSHRPRPALIRGLESG